MAHDFFLGIPVFCLLRVSVYTHQGQWLLQILAFHGRILDRYSVVLAFAKTTREFALQTPRIYLIYLLYQSRPALSWWFAWYCFCIIIGRLFRLYTSRGFVPVSKFCKTPIFIRLPFRSAGIQPIIQSIRRIARMLVFRRYVQCESCYKIYCFEKFYIFLPIFIVLGFIDDSTILFNIKYFLQAIRKDCRDAVWYTGWDLLAHFGLRQVSSQSYLLRNQSFSGKEASLQSCCPIIHYQQNILLPFVWTPRWTLKEVGTPTVSFIGKSWIIP